jgi:hypothetical protein
MCGTVYYQSPCTSWSTWLNTSTFWCAVGLPFMSGFHIPGLVYWTPATFTGTLTWENWSNWADPIFERDDDYTWNMATPKNAGLTSSSGPHGLHEEADSDQTIDHFLDIPFFRDFHRQVESTGIGDSWITDHEAVSIGIFGIDGFHGPASELHPVLGIAIHENLTPDPNDDRWAIFAQNMGNGGACGEDNQNYPLPWMLFDLKHPQTSYAGTNWENWTTGCGSFGNLNPIGHATGRSPDGGLEVGFRMAGTLPGHCWIAGEISTKLTLLGPPPPTALTLQAGAQVPHGPDSEESGATLFDDMLPPDKKAKVEAVHVPQLSEPSTSSHKSPVLRLQDIRNPVTIPNVQHSRDTNRVKRREAYVKALRAAYGGPLPWEHPPTSPPPPSP